MYAPLHVYVDDFMLTLTTVGAGDHFKATVAISSIGWVRARSQRFIDVGLFASKQEALDAAECAGREWVQTSRDHVHPSNEDAPACAPESFGAVDEERHIGEVITGVASSP